MLHSYFSPLAPAGLLLLSAFILFVLIPRLPKNWRLDKFVNAPTLVGVSMLLTLLGVHLGPGSDPTGAGLQMLSGWHFATTGPAAALAVQVDPLSLSFLIVTFLMLLAVTLLLPVQPQRLPNLLGWLVMGAAASILFVAANGLTLIYAVLLFDGCTAAYWVSRHQKDRGLARLFLTIVTAAAIMLTPLREGSTTPALLLGFALWLRLGLYIMVETVGLALWQAKERLIYTGLSLAVGIYLAIRLVTTSLPGVVYWITVLTMLVSGCFTWWAGHQSRSMIGRRPMGRTTLLHWLFVTEALLVLLVAPVSINIAAAFAVGLLLSLTVLWITPALGPPQINDRAWSWPYLPALVSTLTVIGVPLSLGWPAREAIYEAIFRIGNLPILAGLVIVAEGLALSGLIYYWLLLIRGRETNVRPLVVGVVVMVPFLTPGLAPFVLSALTGADLGSANLSQAGYVSFGVTGLLAGGSVYLQRQYTKQSATLAGVTTTLPSLAWLLRQLERQFDGLGRLVLRVQVVLEGQHYIGWAIFSAVIGMIIILLA